MGNSSSCSYWGILLILQLTQLGFFTSTTSAQNNTASGVGYPSPSIIEKAKFSPFKPSMAVIVGALTATFSITFLVLLYARHCKRNSSGAGANFYRSDQYYHYSSSVGRKNSGIDRSVVESLPVFRFGALRTQDELECAVCLNKFECSEVLRLLPKCRHAFHVECVDTWLDAHSTCPLCRFRVDPEDVLLVADSGSVLFRPLLDQQRDIEGCSKNSSGGYQRVSGRHSSAGERVFQVVDTASLRRSVDSWRQSRRNKRDSSRKDGLLLSQSIPSSSTSNNDNNKTEHRIIVPQRSGPGKHDQRWSDVQPSDLLYLQSEIITSNNSRRFSSGSRPTRHDQQLHLFRYEKRQQNGTGNCVGVGIGIGIDDAGSSSGGKRVINSSSVSEITGMSRYSNDNIRGRNDTNHQQDQDQPSGLLSN